MDTRDMKKMLKDWWWLSGKEFASNARRRWGFYPCVGKIPWRRKWQPTPVFLPGKCHGMVGCSPQGLRELDVMEVTEHAWNIPKRPLGNSLLLGCRFGGFVTHPSLCILQRCKPTQHRKKQEGLRGPWLSSQRTVPAARLLAELALSVEQMSF